MAKVITICSGKGGTGKTISAINLGIALNSMGKSVAIIDGNLTMPNIALHLGAPSPPATISHVLLGKASIHDAIYEHSSGTKIVPGSISISSIPKAGESGDRFGKIVQHLKKENDFIIIDSAPGLSEEALLSLKACDEILVVTNPELPAVADALKTAKMAERMKKRVIGAIVTKIRKDDSELAIRNVKKLLELPILAKVPEDDSVRHSIASRNAVVITHPKSPASQAYMRLASKIAREDYRDEKSFLERIFGWMLR